MGYIHNIYGAETLRSVAISVYDLFSLVIDELYVFENM